jgi:AraC family transcriptional regulator
MFFISIRSRKMEQEQFLPNVACRASTVASHFRAVERVILAMRERLDEPLSLEDLADIAVISPYHFDRVFRQIAGIPPCQFLGALRIQKAKRLLLTTPLSVTDICFEVGYNSLGTFITRFTQLVGLSPRRLRQLAKVVSASSARAFRSAPGRKAKSSSEDAGLKGKIEATEAFDGSIFVGLFPTAIPQCKPVRCTFLASPGDFYLPPPPAGNYRLLAAGIAWSDNPLGFLLADSSSMSVGSAPVALSPEDGQVQGDSELSLRPMQVTDPPVLIALPFLLSEALALNEKMSEGAAKREPAYEDAMYEDLAKATVSTAFQ